MNKIKHVLKQILISIDRVNSLSTLNCRKNSTLVEILENYQDINIFKNLFLFRLFIFFKLKYIKKKINNIFKKKK